MLSLSLAAPMLGAGAIGSGIQAAEAAGRDAAEAAAAKLRTSLREAGEPFD